MDPRKAADQVRNITVGASREVSTAIKKFLTALFKVTVSENDRNREQYKAAVDRLNSVPLVTPEDAESLKRLNAEVRALSNGLNKRITEKANDSNYDLMQQTREKFDRAPSEEKVVSRTPTNKRGNTSS